MKKIKLIILISLNVQLCKAQNVGIGTAAPNTSALLDVSSTTKGLLIPRMTTTEMNNISSPATGLTIYNTTDSAFYTKRPAGWKKFSYGDDNLWKRFNNNMYSFSNNYVGINYSDLAAVNLVGQYAPLQTRGMIGNTMAVFGEDKQGISLVGNYPGIFFNSYFNGGVKSMNAGATANITLNQNNPPYYEFGFGDYATGADQPMSNAVKMALRNDGHLYVGNSSVNFSRANFEQQGSVGGTAAIFGGDGTGISLQKNWPAIGFNSYLDASNHRSIAQGYGAQLGLNQLNGSLYLVSFPFNAVPNTLFSSYTQRFFLSRFGKMGIGADDPYTDIEITQRTLTFANEDVDVGITYKATSDYGSGVQPSDWNTHVGYGQYGQFGSLQEYSFWNRINNGNWHSVAAILTTGEYYQASDRELKTDINYLGNDCLSKILQLKPASYHFKRTEHNAPLSFGFIAQDIETVFPEIVFTGKTNKLLSYSSLVPILTKGMQQQQQQIDLLQQQNKDLKARLELLEKKF